MLAQDTLGPDQTYIPKLLSPNRDRWRLLPSIITAVKYNACFLNKVFV